MIPDLPLEELARRYNNGAAVPDWADTLLPRWQRGSERVRADAAGARDVAYGQLPRNCFDVFAPKGAAPRTVGRRSYSSTVATGNACRKTTGA